MAENEIITIDEQEKLPLMRLIENPAIIRRFEMICGKQAGTAMMGIINAANLNPEIWKCEPMSVINAGLNAAELNLSTAPSLGLACILPYKKWKKQGNDFVVDSIRASFVPMKRGIRELAMRTNKYRVLNSFCVYEGQQWEENQLTGIGRPVGPIVDKSKKIGYGAYLLLVNGYEATYYMEVEKIMAHVERYSPSWDKQKRRIKDNTKWATDFDMMAEGVVLKALIRHKGVMSDKDRRILEDSEREFVDAESVTVSEETIESAEPVTEKKHTEAENLAALGFEPEQPKPIAQPFRTRRQMIIQRWDEVAAQAEYAGIVFDAFDPESATDAEIIEHGKALKAEIEKLGR